MRRSSLLFTTIKQVQKLIKHDLNIVEKDRLTLRVAAGSGGNGLSRWFFYSSFGEAKMKNSKSKNKASGDKCPKPSENFISLKNWWKWVVTDGMFDHFPQAIPLGSCKARTGIAAPIAYWVDKYFCHIANFELLWGTVMSTADSSITVAKQDVDKSSISSQ